MGLKQPLKLVALPLSAGALLMLTGCPFFNQGLTIHSIYVENQTLSVGNKTQVRIQASTLPGRKIQYQVRAERGRVLTGDPALDQNNQVAFTERETVTYHSPFTSRYPDPQGNQVQGDTIHIQVTDGFSTIQQSERINLGGDTMVFVKESSGAGSGELWAATVDEGGFSVTNLRPLKDRNGQTLRGGSPTTSPDGRQIAFVYYPGSGSYSGIFTLDSAGFVKNLTGMSANSGMNLDPSWAPDSHQLAFASDRGGNFDIYRVTSDREGNAPTKITSTQVDERYPAWNPSLNPERRSTLAVSVKSSEIQPQTEGQTWNLYKLDIASGAYIKRLTQLTVPGDFAWEPQWRADGAYLAYTRKGPILNNNTDSQRKQRIYVCYADANDEGFPLNIKEQGSEISESAPVWNPNGTEIAYLRIVSGANGGVYRQTFNSQLSSAEFPRLWQDFNTPIPPFQINETQNEPRFPFNGLSLNWR